MNKCSSLFISVVMPVYNCDKYIRESIESILNQTYKNFEFIIINDGSTDNSLNIIRDYANKDYRIKIINQPNSGIVRALNRGLFEAKGEWIFRMDGDDIALPCRFDIQIETIKKNSSLVLIGGACQQINSEGIPIKINKYPSEHNKLINILENGKAFFPHPTACFYRDVVVKLGGYREHFKHAEDIDLWLRLINVGKFTCCKNVVLKLRKHEENISKLDNGRIQQVKAMTARVCYFRRKYGLSESILFTETYWKKFLVWVEERMDTAGYFQQMQELQILRNIWYSNLSINRLKRIYVLLKKLTKSRFARKAVYSRFQKDNFALKLAKESDKLF